MTTYHVANWGDNYENNRSRKVKDLAWVPIPNKHDGERYSRLMARKDAAQIFSAWILILQVASRCHPRGSLLRSDGTPHDSESLSIKTRAPKAWFDVAFPILVEMRWLTAQKHEQTSLALDCHQTATAVPPSCQSGDEERRERTEEKGREDSAAGAAAARPAEFTPVAPDSRHHEITQRWGLMYRGAFDMDYMFASKDPATLKRFLLTNRETAAEILETAAQAWHRAKTDRFARRCKEAGTIHGLCTFYNEIRLELRTPNSDSGNGKAGFA